MASRSDLYKNVGTALNLTAVEARNTVDTVLDQMLLTMQEDDRLEVRDFGIFTIRNRPARLGRNPLTGANVKVPAGRTVTFKVSKSVRENLSATVSK